MQPESAATTSPKWMTWAGWIMSIIPTGLLLMGGVMAVTQQPTATEGFEKYGYPEGILPILGAIEIACALIYIVPQTAVLGAILVTAYLGGAVNTHVHADESNWYMAVGVAVLAWGGLYLRDRRIRDLIPLRKKSA